MPRLIVIDGIDEGKQFDLEGDPVVIGRDASSTIRLFDTEVSRKHAELRKTPHGYRLVDAGSANGTFVNDLRVEEADLRPGDRILVGRTTLVYSTGDLPTPLPSRAEKIRMTGDAPSAIIRKLGSSAGSHILTRPDVNSDWLRVRLANLAIMYEATQAVRHVDDQDRLLEKILELLFRSVEADRGCVLLHAQDGEALQPRAIRYADGGGDGGEIALSRTIIDHVLREREGVLVVDAGQDQRFTGGASIVRLGIREAICVPLVGREAPLGVLYFDTFRATRDAAANPEATRFSEDHLTLAVAVAHQTALAIEAARDHAALVQSERLAAVGQAIAALSHHIKNILQGMKSGGELLHLGIKEKDDAALQAGWRLLDRNQTRIYDLVLDMLSFSKDREPGREPVDLARVAAEVVELVKSRAAEAGITLTIEGEAPVVPADAEGIHRALLNLVSNAIDAVEESPAPTVTLHLASDAQWATLSVIDNGCGIDAEQMRQLFRPFQSTKGSRGTGLGLAVSRKTLREHGGDIDVKSDAGRGSEFTLRLPVR